MAKAKVESKIPFTSAIGIICLTAFLLMGNVDVKTLDPEMLRQQSLITLSKGSSLNDFKTLYNDAFKFIRDFKKTNTFELNKEVKNNLLPSITNLSRDLERLKKKELELQSILDAAPTEEYRHSKITLSSFIVDKLKREGLIYEIVYNYSEPVEEVADPNNPQTEQEQILSTSYSDKFLIRIYNIDKGDNYSKLVKVLDEIFIREAYQIPSLKMEYDNVSKGYYLEIVFAI